jgi:hypothetical protein
MVLVVDIACFLVIFRATSNNVMVAGQAILQSTVYGSVLVYRGYVVRMHMVHVHY